MQWCGKTPHCWFAWLSLEGLQNGIILTNWVYHHILTFCWGQLPSRVDSGLLARVCVCVSVCVCVRGQLVYSARDCSLLYQGSSSWSAYTSGTALVVLWLQGEWEREPLQDLGTAARQAEFLPISFSFWLGNLTKRPFDTCIHKKREGEKREFVRPGISMRPLDFLGLLEACSRWKWHTPFDDKLCTKRASNADSSKHSTWGHHKTYLLEKQLHYPLH